MNIHLNQRQVLRRHESFGFTSGPAGSNFVSAIGQDWLQQLMSLKPKPLVNPSVKSGDTMASDVSTPEIS